MKKHSLLLNAFWTLVLSCSLVSCGNSGVPEHEHVYDNGTVTVEPTCHSLGEKTYKCTFEGCEQTKTESIQMLEHNWNDGVVTKPATCTETGTKLYTCKNEGCGQTREITLDKLPHDYQPGDLKVIPTLLEKGQIEMVCSVCGDKHVEDVDAHANFAEQYEMDQSHWGYYYLESFSDTAEDVELLDLEKVEGVYKHGGVEVTRGNVKADGYAAIAYKVTEVEDSISVNLDIHFDGELEETRVAATLLVLDLHGHIEDKIDISTDSSSWECETNNAININKDHALCVVFSGSGEHAKGAFDMTITAKCVHVWDEGEVTKPAACNEEGQITYHCINEGCDETKVVSTPKLGHTWNDGVVTTEPTEESAGVMTYTCTVCGETKTEEIPMLKKSIANFKDDFNGFEDHGWLYGYATDYNFDNDTFIYNALTAEESWKLVDSSGKIELHPDWMQSESDEGRVLAVGYKVAEGNNSLDYKVTFASVAASNKETRFSMRLLVINASGETKKCEFFNADAADWDKAFNDLAVEGGDTVYTLLFKERDPWRQGVLQIEIKGQVPYTPVPAGKTEIANFKNDFSTTEDKGWLYGYATDYNFDNDTFTYNPLTAPNDWSFVDDSGKIEVKSDWMQSESDEGRVLALGYKVVNGNDSLDYKVTFTSVADANKETRFALRLLVVSKTGETKFFDYYYENTADWEKEYKDLAVEGGDTVYALLFKESDAWRQGVVQIVVNGQEKYSPATKKEIANFKNDFSTTEDKGWLYGYGTDYNFTSNTFTYNPLTAPNDWSFVDDSGKIEVKSDWMQSESDEGRVLALGYKVVNGNDSLDYKVTFTSVADANKETRFALRLLVVSKTGETKFFDYYYENTADWEKEYKDLAVEGGDTVYALLFKESDAWRQGVLDITVKGQKAYSI